MQGWCPPGGAICHLQICGEIYSPEEQLRTGGVPLVVQLVNYKAGARLVALKISYVQGRCTPAGPTCPLQSCAKIGSPGVIIAFIFITPYQAELTASQLKICWVD